MEDPENTFALALRTVDERQLKEAFDYCNRQSDLQRYDRTALSRWLSGTIPTRGDFIATLAERLGDLTVYEAWVASTDTSAADMKSVVTRFRRLPPDSKSQVFERIRQDLIATSPTIREHYSIRVDVRDSNTTSSCLELQVGLNWDGPLPPEANVRIGSHEDNQKEILDQEDCLFRDLVPMERDRLVTALKDVGWGPPTLTYQSLGSGRPASGSIAATELSPGFYAFDNPALRMARIKVRIAYPFPRGRNAFPVLFRGYQVAAPATVTLVLHSQHTYSPGGYAFLGIGRQWHVSEFAGGRELVVDAGEPNDLLGSDTGIFLFWSEHDPNDPTIESFI